MKAAVTVKENYEFRRIYRKGKSLVSPQMVLYWQKNRQGQSRLGITVSTKLGHAVVRNRVRRRFRELYRLHKPEMQPGFDVILVARGRAVRSTYQQLDETYLRLLRQAGLVRRRRYEAGAFEAVPVLPDLRLPSFSAPVPLYPHLLGVCRGGGGEIRRRQGRPSGPAPSDAMPSFPQGRV